MAEQRIIKYGGRQFPMEPGMTLEQAKEVMARHFPELADPKVETKKDGETTTYVFSKQAGHKGARRKRTAHQRVLGSLECVKAIDPVQPDVVRFARGGRVPHVANWTHDQFRNMARDLQEAADQVTRIGDALLDLPSASAPEGSIL